MFKNCKTFNQDISSWDLLQVSDMQYMFSFAPAFNTISKWGIDPNANFYRMLNGATEFNLKYTCTTTYDGRQILASVKPIIVSQI